jgi:hypothetical protein
MMRYLLILISIIFYSNVYSHVDLFKISDCKIQPNEKLIYSYSYNIKLENTEKIYYLKEVGIFYFNVGDDEYSNMNIKIYDLKDLNKPLFANDTVFRDVYGQTAYFKTLLFLKGGNEYKIIIKPNQSINDDIVNLVTPNSMPYFNSDFNIRINNIKNSLITEEKFNQTENCPLLSLGINEQEGINVISEQIVSYKKIETNNSSFLTEFKSLVKKFSIKEIQIYLLDLSENNKISISLKIVNNSNNETKLKDTILYKIDSSKIIFNIPFTYDFEANNVYTLGISFNDSSDRKDIVLFYQPNDKPYIDNTEHIEIERFYKNNIEDSLGLVLDLIFNLNYLETLNMLKLETNKLNIYNDLNYIHISNVYSKFKIFDILGNEIFFNFNIDNQEILIDKNELEPGIYFIQDNLKTTSFVLN